MQVWVCVFLIRVKWQTLKNRQLCVATLLQCFVFTDEKERFDPTQFQDCIIQGLTETGTDLEAVAKFLDASGAKLDYRRYAETLFDILVAGGMLGKSLWWGCCQPLFTWLQKLTVFFQCKNSAKEPTECVEQSLSYLW